MHMTNRLNPYRDLSSTLRLDVTAYRITRSSKAPVLKQSHATKIPETAVFQHVNVNVSFTHSFKLPLGYTNTLVVTSPYSFKVVLTQGINVVEFMCLGTYSTIGNFEGIIEIFGLDEEFTRCSIVSA